MDDHSIKNEQDGQQVEPNLSFVAQNETVSTTTNMSPPPARTVPTSSRPSTLQLGGQRLGSSILLTPNDYNKLLLSTPELDEKLRAYTIISNTTPTVQLQTPDLINAISAQPAGSITFVADGQPSPGLIDTHSLDVLFPIAFFIGVKVIEELLNAHQQYQQQQQQQQQQQIHPDNANRQYIVVPPEAHHIFQQFSSSVGGEQRLLTNNDQLAQLTQAIQKAIAAGTPTSADGQNQTQLQETILTFLNNRMTVPQANQDLMPRNRSISSSMDTSMNGNESSNSALSSTATSPIPNHMQHNTIMLNKVKDEPQHVPTSRTNTSGSSIERINLEHNEVVKKEKKRERNRQVDRVDSRSPFLIKEREAKQISILFCFLCLGGTEMSNA